MLCHHPRVGGSQVSLNPCCTPPCSPAPSLGLAAHQGLRGVHSVTPQGPWRCLARERARVLQLRSWLPRLPVPVGSEQLHHGLTGCHRAPEQQGLVHSGMPARCIPCSESKVGPQCLKAKSCHPPWLGQSLGHLGPPEDSVLALSVSFDSQIKHAHLCCAACCLMPERGGRLIQPPPHSWKNSPTHHLWPCV